MKILCVGDSLGLPREGILYQDTWFYKLSSKYRDIDFIYKFKRGLTTNNLVAKNGLEYNGEYSCFYMPDIVITQFGIVDCAPRYINDQRGIGKLLKESAKLLKIESFFWRLIKYVKKRERKCVYVNINEFANNLEVYVNELVNEIGVKTIIFIKIGMPGKDTLTRSPFISDNIKVYNNVFDTLSLKYPNIITVVDPLGTGDDSLYIDGYHTNSKGADCVFKTLEEKLLECQIIKN